MEKPSVAFVHKNGLLIVYEQDVYTLCPVDEANTSFGRCGMGRTRGSENLQNHFESPFQQHVVSRVKNPCDEDD